MERGKYDCNDYGDKSIKEVEKYCLDCEQNRVHQLAYYKGNENDKVSFCTNCGKTYSCEL